MSAIGRRELLINRPRRPTVFAHRGASGHRPESTEESYELAARMGADFCIEADLVPTKDGVLIARHESELSGTTDVADHPEFAGRRVTKSIDGEDVTGWFSEDFTLAEVKRLRAVERIPDLRVRNTIFDGRFQVPSLEEILTFARRTTWPGPAEVRMAFETKHPTYFRSLGLALEPRLVAALRRHRLDRADGRVVVGSFEPTSLTALRSSSSVELIQNVGPGSPYDTVARGAGPTFDDLVSPAGLRSVARYARWVGPNKSRVVPVGADGTLGDPTALVRDAHRAGLKVAPYTFRNENDFLPPSLRVGDDPSRYGNALAEYDAFFRAGVDGVWSDHPDTALVAVARWRP